MFNSASERRLAYDYAVQAAQQVVNGGANPQEVEAFIDSLSPLFEERPLKLMQQPFPVNVAPVPMAANGERPRIEIPSAWELEGWQDAIVGAAIMAVPPVGITVNVARGVAAAAKVTIGMGPQVSGAAGVGISLGAGACVTPNGKLGVYGSVAGLAGALASISATIQITIIGGGVENFRGWCWGAGITGGEVVVGNAAALLSMTSPVNFMGVTVGIGVGYGIPLEVFVTAQHTWAAAG